MFDFEIRERDDEDMAAARYDDLYHGFPLSRYWDRDFFEFVAATVTEGDRILDVGCGPGSMFPHWANLSRPARIVGIDLSPGMIEEARRRHPNAEFQVGRLHELPFPDGSFDVVVASAVLHHVPEDHLDGALDEILRVLDEHGRIVIREPNERFFGQEPGWFSGAIMAFRHLAFRLTHSREYPEPQLGDHHSPIPQETLVEKVGMRLSITRLSERYPFSPYVLRVRSTAVASFAEAIDRKLEGRRGAMYYLEAGRNVVDAEEVGRIIGLAREERGISDAEFLACLEHAAVELEALFGEKT